MKLSKEIKYTYSLNTVYQFIRYDYMITDTIFFKNSCSINLTRRIIARFNSKKRFIHPYS